MHYVRVTGKYIGINSFGFGGVNGHVILEPYTDTNKEDFVYGKCLHVGRYCTVTVYQFVGRTGLQKCILHQTMIKESLGYCRFSKK